MSDLADVAEKFGSLVAVNLRHFEPGWIESVHFEFVNGSLQVDVDINTDTINWGLGSATKSPLPTPREWVDLLSGRVRWIWLLTNQRGFTDALQMEIAVDDGFEYVQLLAEGSRLVPFRLKAFDSRK